MGGEIGADDRQPSRKRPFAPQMEADRKAKPVQAVERGARDTHRLAGRPRCVCPAQRPVHFRERAFIHFMIARLDHGPRQFGKAGEPRSRAEIVGLQTGIGQPRGKGGAVGGMKIGQSHKLAKLVGGDGIGAQPLRAVELEHHRRQDRMLVVRDRRPVAQRRVAAHLRQARVGQAVKRGAGHRRSSSRRGQWSATG